MRKLSEMARTEGIAGGESLHNFCESVKYTYQTIAGVTKDFLPRGEFDFAMKPTEPRSEISI
jgi:hypothetical protein